MEKSLRSDNNYITFFVPGDPVPKQSFRYTKNGGGFTDPRMKAWQDTVTILAKSYFHEPLKGNIRLMLVFNLRNRRKVDCDNLSKGVMDGLKNIAFGDDSKVTQLFILKYYNKALPGVRVWIKNLDKEGQ